MSSSSAGRKWTPGWSPRSSAATSARSRRRPTPAPRRRGASANWSAFTSSPAPPTTSRKFSRFAESVDAALALPLRADGRAEIAQQTLVAHHEQRLRRRLQQVEECAAGGARVDLPAVGQQLYGSSAARGLEQPMAEVLLQDAQQLVQLMDRESASAQVGEHEELEELDWRVAALGIAACFGPMRRHGGRQQTS